MQIQIITHMGQFPQDGENGQNMASSFIFLDLCCDQTVWLFQLLNCSEEILPVRFYIFVLVLAHLEPELELFEFDDDDDDDDNDGGDNFHNCLPNFK